MADILFTTIENWHSMRGVSWGRFLDAGTGIHSLQWIQKLETAEWVAITADNSMKTNTENDALIKERIRDVDKILVGNWMDSQFCGQLGKYDTILADYLIGIYVDTNFYLNFRYPMIIF